MVLDDLTASRYLHLWDKTNDDIEIKDISMDYVWLYVTNLFTYVLIPLTYNCIGLYMSECLYLTEVD